MSVVQERRTWGPASAAPPPPPSSTSFHQWEEDQDGIGDGDVHLIGEGGRDEDGEEEETHHHHFTTHD